MSEKTEEKKRPLEMNEEEFQAHLESAPEHTEKSDEGDFYHVPIGYLEPDLRYTFNGDINITIRKIKIKDGILTLIVRLKVFHPVKKEYQKFDGIAATIIQSIKPGKWEGSTVSITSDDIKPEVAACYSEALKSAAKKIGKRFGSDVNRINAPGKQKEAPEQKKKRATDERILHLINDAEDIPALNALIKDLPQTEEVQTALNNKLRSLKKTKK